MTTAKTTHGTQKTLSVPQKSTEKDLTLAEALEVANFLQARGVLCLGCGYRVAVLATTNQQTSCEECKRPDMSYNVFRKGTAFEKLLCRGLERYAQTLLGRE